MNEQYKAQLITPDNKDQFLRQKALTPSEKGFIQLAVDKGLIIGREVGIEFRGFKKFPDFAVLNPKRHNITADNLERSKDGNILVDRGDERWCILELTVTPANSLRADSPFVYTDNTTKKESPKRQQLCAMRSTRARWGFLTYENLLHMQTYSGYTFFSDDPEDEHGIDVNCPSYIEECQLLGVYPRLGNNRGLKLMPKNVSGAEWKNNAKLTFEELSSRIEEKRIAGLAKVFITRIGARLAANNTANILLDDKSLLERNYGILMKLFRGEDQLEREAESVESRIKPLECVVRNYEPSVKYEELKFVDAPEAVYENFCANCWFSYNCYAKKVMEGYIPPLRGIPKENLEFYEPSMTESQSVYKLLTNVALHLSNPYINQNDIARKIFCDPGKKVQKEQVYNKSKFVSRLVEFIEQDLVNILGMDGYIYLRQRNADQKLSRIEGYQSLNQEICSIWLRFQRAQKHSSGFHRFMQRWYYYTKYGVEPQTTTDQFKHNWNLENIRNLMCNKDYKRQGKTVREMNESFKVHLQKE